jgi:hypothetical protein
LSTLLYLPMIALTIPVMVLMSSAGAGATPESTALIGLLSIAVGLVSLLWYPVMWGALTVLASERYLGREIEPGDAIRRAFGRYASLLGSMTAKWAIVFFTMFFSWILLFVPTFYLLVRWFAIPATVVLENRGVGASFSRSSQLSINQKMRIFGTLFLAWMIVIVVAVAVFMLVLIIVGMTMAGGDAEALSGTSSMMLQLPSIFAYILLLPIVIITETLLYYDVRIRQEGYDIELMSAQLPGVGAGVAAN